MPKHIKKIPWSSLQLKQWFFILCSLWHSLNVYKLLIKNLRTSLLLEALTWNNTEVETPLISSTLNEVFEKFRMHEGVHGLTNEIWEETILRTTTPMCILPGIRQNNHHYSSDFIYKIISWTELFFDYFFFSEFLLFYL